MSEIEFNFLNHILWLLIYDITIIIIKNGKCAVQFKGFKTCTG